ncbi:MAG: T9SS type A sorting domain-containing protein, partial [Ignavibacteria bacterium]|nr:T9SS type A sorting domain-containing protein [Ignavibacteria bacterium]
CIAVSGSAIHVVWYDTRDDIFGDIYYKYSSNGGINWGTDTRLTYNIANSNNPSIAVSGSIVHVTWFDNRDGNYEIYYKYSSNGGINWGADTRLTYNNAESQYPSIAISGSIIHVIWQDNRNGNHSVYYKRNPTGNIGIKNISSEVPEKSSLYQNYPNPFNPVTKIRFDVHSTPLAPLQRGTVSLVVYDITGKEVAVLVNEELQAGSYEVTFDASGLPSGVYYYRLSGSNFTESKKMMLVK